MLNPQLYDALCHAFGKVTVYSRGEPATYTAQFKTSLDKGGKTWASNVTGGEHYETDCPLCGMHKLWFSYLAGTVVESKDEPDLWFTRGLMQCFYCQGTFDAENRKRIWARITPSRDYFHVKKEQVFRTDSDWMFDISGDTSSEGNNIPSVVFPSGVGISDQSVPKRVTDYLKGRDVDPVQLERECAACWCPNPTGNGIGRITFPIYRNSTLVGWQGRALPEDCSKTVPKYWTCGQKASWLFNLDRARWFPFGVLVEGVFDSFRVGIQGVCRFGKSTSVQQLRMLVSCWGDQGVLVIPDMNDPDALPAAIKETTEWNSRKLFKEEAKVVILPKDKDPGSMKHEEIVSIVKEQTGRTLQ